MRKPVWRHGVSWRSRVTKDATRCCGGRPDHRRTEKVVSTDWNRGVYPRASNIGHHANVSRDGRLASSAIFHGKVPEKLAGPGPKNAKISAVTLPFASWPATEPAISRGIVLEEMAGSGPIGANLRR